MHCLTWNMQMIRSCFCMGRILQLTELLAEDGQKQGLNIDTKKTKVRSMLTKHVKMRSGNECYWQELQSIDFANQSSKVIASVHISDTDVNYRVGKKTDTCKSPILYRKHPPALLSFIIITHCSALTMKSVSVPISTIADQLDCLKVVLTWLPFLHQHASLCLLVCRLSTLTL